MTKTAFRRLFLTSIPAAFIATTTFADAGSVAPIAHVPSVTHTALGARPVVSRSLLRVGGYANSTPRSTFVAGGATLPALAYIGVNALSQNPGLPSSGSIFGEFAALSGVTTQYCQTGSGFGKEVFDGLPGATAGVNGPCAALNVSPGATNGFGAPASLGLTDPDITGTDAPLAQSEYTEFVMEKSKTRGEPVQLPSIVGSIAMLYNNPDLPNGTKINLSDAEICGIVEGKINTWTTITGGKSNKPLSFVYRTGGSGTTFSFSNYLLTACSSSGLNTSQYFTGAVAPNVNVFPGTLPANFVGESGNVGLSTYIKATPYTIGYAEAANALTVLGGSTNFATVDKYDPIKDLPQTAAALNYSAKNVVSDEAVVTTGGKATIAPLTGVAKAGCVTLVVPAAYADIKLKTGNYSIVAVTNLLFSTTGNGATNAGHLQTLVNELNTPSLFGTKITTVNAPTKQSGTGTTGYAALGSTFNAPLEAVAKKCIGA